MEKQLLRKLSLIVLSSLVLSACAKKKQEADSGSDLGFDSYTVVSGNFSDLGDGAISGTGAVRFLNTTATPNSRYSIHLRADLINNGASVILISNSSSVLLDDGVQIRFIRRGNEVNGEIQVNNQATRSVQPTRMTSLLPNSLDLVVEIHNEAPAPRVLIWAFESPYSVTAALLDSAQVGQLDQSLPTTTATGVFTGLRINNASVFTARLKSNNVK